MVGRIGRRATSLRAQSDKTASFKERYEQAERRRADVMQRLQRLNEAARGHPAYKRALTLLNQTFRKASVAQRLATVQAAEWLIDVLENLTMLV
jgi:hypothetical protein